MYAEFEVHRTMICDRVRTEAFRRGGGTPTREDAERDCLSAIAFALEGDPRDYDTDAETLAFDVNVRQQRSQPDSTAASGCHRRIEVQRTQSAPCGMRVSSLRVCLAVPVSCPG